MKNTDSVIHFNFAIASYIDETWLVNIRHGDIIAHCRKTPSSIRHLSKFLLRHFGIANQYAFDIPDSIRPIAFLTNSELEKLIRFAGAVINSERIKKVIFGKDIEKLKSYIGEDAYFYGLKRAPLFRKLCVQENSREIPIEDLNETTIQTGVCGVMGLIDELPRAIKQRIIVKMPYDWVQPKLKNDYRVRSSDFSVLMSAIQKDIVQSAAFGMVKTA